MRCVCFSCFFTAAPLVEATDGKRIAFVVGINIYDNLAKERQLANAVNDAQETSRTLKKVGFDVVEGINVTISDFDKKWQAILERMTSEDTLVFFFSGHGVEVDGENLLLPRDIPVFEFGRHKQFQRRAVSVSELLKDLRTGDRQHPKVTVMILDACRENPTIPPEYRTKGGMPQGGLAKVPKTRGTFMLYAAEPGKVSLDRLGPLDKHPNSVYTRSLLPLLEQTNLPIQDLAIKVKERVYALTEKVGYEQLSEYTDGLIGQFCLAGCVAKADKGIVGFKEDLTATVQPSLHRELTGKDGAPMVLIPAGSFLMGSTKEEVDRAIRDCIKELEKDQQTCAGWYKPEFPQHKVQMRAFYFDRYEVTNWLFQQFTQQTGYRTTAEQEGSAFVFVERKGWEDVKGANWQKPEASATVFDSNRAEHPVVSVSWDDAQAYCRWAEKRLPTEAEFEYATRAGTTTTYWWGQGSPGSRRVENIADEAAKHLLKSVMTGYHDGAVRTAPVGSYDANPWGLHDINGNAREWTADWFDGDYYSKSPVRDPPGPSTGQYRVLRGGSWGNEPVNVRSAFRSGLIPAGRSDGIGFRCAQDQK